MCGTERQGPNSIFCANYGTYRTGFYICKSVWCPECYVSHPNDEFHVNVRRGESGLEWLHPKDEKRFQCGRSGDHLMCPFQCDICVFLFLTGRQPNVLRMVDDNLLMICIRRAILDSFWARESSTVQANRREIEKYIRILKTVGVTPQFEPSDHSQRIKIFKGSL